MLSNDSPGRCAAIVDHHMQALGAPELQLALPHLQLAALRSQQHWAGAVELMPAMLRGQQESQGGTNRQGEAV